MSRKLTCGPALVALVLASSVPLFAQEAATEQERRQRTLDRTRQLLVERPAHAALFDRYFKLLVSGNSVDDEIQTLEAALEKDPGEQATSVVLGRLMLRAGKEQEALEVLDGITDKTSDIQSVLGDIYQKLARFDAAVRAFEAALPSAKTSEEKRVLFEKKGKAQLALGDKKAAVATWQKIAELDGGKFHRRLRVAELLVEAGLLDEATAAYAPLLEESVGDPAQHCRVLRDRGLLEELRGELDAALATYDRVLELTARGNWLRKEVEKRMVQVYRRTGRLEALVGRLEEQIDARPDDLAATELLADVLTEMRELDRASAVLGAVTPRFPRDVRLARRVAQLHEQRGDIDAAIAEYQRILQERPDQLELYLDLGTLFAEGDRFNEAKNQWDKALAQRLEDASLCTRIAAMYALWGRHDDAIRLYERAIELEPESIVRYSDLAEYLFAQRERDRGAEVLVRAREKAAGKPRRLEVLAGVYREHDFDQEARACLEQLVELEPDNQEGVYALADLLLDLGETERARAMFWQVVEKDTKATGFRTMAANTLVYLAARAGDRTALIAEAERRDTAGAAFVLGRTYSRSRDFDNAIASFRLALERKPDDVEARRMLARLLAEEGDFRGALQEFEQLTLIAPGERRRQFREVARLHLEMYELDEAMEVWNRAMRDHPDVPAVFLEVGRELMDIQRVQEALEAFRQASRLKSRDPDIQLRLAKALRQAGKSEEAEQHLLVVAIEALDTRDREQARSELFELYAELGEIDKKIEALLSTVGENPYDVDAPQLLADLYMRTGDYVLGLEMVEKAIKFQPRNRELLTRQCELLEFLEEWEKAYDVHAELLKFPDADRDVHVAGMGQALYEIGRAEEAKEAFKKIRDRGRVSKLYKKYHLHDEAIDYYERAIARNPSELSSYVRLAEQLVERNRRDDAIAALEKVLNIRPYYRGALELVGKLYVQAGRRDEAVKVGMRLFGLRGEEVRQTRREEYEEKKEQAQQSWGYGYNQSRQQSFGQRRLESAQQYFEERGLAAEWGEILVAEARRRPADLTLIDAVYSHYSWRDKSAAKSAAFLTDLLSRDLSKMRVPPGHTQRSYRAMLEERLVTIWQQDAAVAQERIDAMGEVSTVPELLELAVLHRSVGRMEAMEEALAKVLTAEPDNPIARTLMTTRCVDEKRFAEAIEHLASLALWWQGPGAPWQDETEQRRLASFSSQRKAMLDGLPRLVRRRVEDEDLRAVIARVRTSTFSRLGTFSFPEDVPEPFAIQKMLVRVCRAAGNDAALAEAVPAAMAMATSLADQSSLGLVLQQEEQLEAAEKILRTVIDAGKKLQTDPVQLYFWTNYYQRFVSQAADPLGQILADRGAVLEAYQVLRENGHGEKAELIIRTHGVVEDVRRVLEGAVAEAAASLEKARAESSGEIRNQELDYRDAVIKLADFQMGEKAFDVAEKIYDDSLALLPDDVDIRQVIAQLRLRRGDADAAIVAHDEIIALKRRLRRARAGDTAIPPTRMTPTVPGQSASSSIASSGTSYYVPWYLRQNRYDVSTNYLAVLQIYSERNDQQGVLDSLRRIMQEDPVIFRSLAWEVLNKLKNQDLGKKKLPILRILKGVVANDEWLSIQYAEACREEGELREAKRTLEKLIARSQGTSDWYVEQAERDLDKVRQKLGESKETVADLREKVDADPENVRHRMRLAQRLQKDHEYAACLIEAQIVVEKAPYMARAKQMVVESAAAAGEDAVAVAMLRRLFEEATESNDKMRQGVHLADWLYASGSKDEAFEIIAGLETQSGGTNQFSPGNWFLDRYQLDLSVKHLAAEYEKHKASPWYAEQIRARLVRVEMAADREVEAVERSYQMIEEAGSLGDREQKFKALLGFMAGHPDPAELYAVLEQRYGAGETAKDRLIMAGAAFVKGDTVAAEKGFSVAAGMSPKEVYLFPLLLGLRRLHGDGEGAVEVLRRMGKVYGGSDTMQWSQGVSLTGRDRLKVERAMILQSMGQEDTATALIESLFDETNPASMLTVSSVYTTLEKPEKALLWRQRYTAKKGTKDKSDMLAEARLLHDLERNEEAMALVKEADVMSRGASDVRSLLITLHRNAGTLKSFVEVLEREFEADPRDKQVRQHLLTLYQELDRDDERRAIYEAMLDEADEREQGLGALSQMATEKGDLEASVGYLKQLLELKGGDQKKQMYHQVAEVQVKMEDLDAAEASYREALDLETADGLRALGDWLLANDRGEAAAERYRAVLEMDPDKYDTHLPLARLAWKAGEFDDAVTHGIAYLREGRGRVLLSKELQTIFLDGLAALPAERRDALLGGGDDLASRETAALLHLARADFDAAAAQARAAVEMNAASLPGLEVLVRALREREPGDELAQRIEAWRQAIEREYVTSSDWNYRNQATALQDELGRLALARGDLERASALWKEQPLRREPYSNAFGSWRSDWNVRYTAEHWLGTGHPQQALAALDLEFLLRESPPWDVYLDALERAGQPELVESITWRRLLDPLTLYGVQQGSNNYYINTSSTQARAEASRLVRSYYERKEMDALRKRAAELSEDPSTAKAGDDLKHAIEVWLRDDVALAERTEEAAEKKDKQKDLNTRYQAVQAWMRAGRPEAALEHMKKILDFDDAALAKTLVNTKRGSSWTMTQVGGSGLSATNPFSFSLGSSGGSYWYSSYSGGRGGLVEYRRVAAGLLFAAGDRDRALAVEKALLDEVPARDRDAARVALARAYGTNSIAPLEAARLWREVLAEPDPKLKDATRGSYLSQLASALRDAGDEEASRAALEEHKALLEKQIAEAPGPHALSLRQQLVAVLLQLHQPREALAALQPVLKWRLESSEHEATLATIYRQNGDFTTAIEIANQLRERRQRMGQDRQSDTSIDANLGLALIGAGREEEGRELLRRTAPRLNRDGELDREVRAALGW